MMKVRSFVMMLALALSCTPTTAMGPDEMDRPMDPAEAEVPSAASDEEPGPLPAPEWERERPSPDAAGVGTLSVTDGADLTTQLDLSQLDVEATVTGHMVAFEVEHRFDNPTDEVLEGTFRFPLPHGAVVTGLAMEIGGELMEGEVLDRDKAREIYQSIVDSMQDPALLEWEQGQTFKLRVFPIEANSQKRVVLRYLAPLHRATVAGGERWEVVVPTAAPTMQGEIGRLSVRVDGQTVVDREHATPTGAVRVEVEAPAEVLRTSDDHGTFTAVRVQPDWDQLPVPDREAGPRRLMVMMDTSRSALESWGLARESLRIVLSSLDERDQFSVVAFDLTARSHAPGFSPATPEQIDAALAFVDSIEPDGASDLGAALEEAGRRLTAPAVSEATQVLVLGDGVPTWGQTDDSELLTQAEQALGEVPVHALVLGRSAQGRLLTRLAGRTGGRVERPQSTDEIEWFSDFLDIAPRLRRLRDVTFSAGATDELATLASTTIFEGQESMVYLRSAVGAEPPTALTLHGMHEAGTVSQVFALPPAAQVGRVRQMWASQRIAEMEREREARAEVVALSEEHGVLSRHTAFLVLESEEAYREHAIERRRAAERAAQEAGPSVTGADLGSGGETSLRPGDLQPGDPEILIPAPADARSVVVVFPFGETKVARWDESSGQWIVRFLVDEDTAPGRYEVAVRITMSDGRVERMTAEYTVDMRAPDVSLTLVPMGDGSFTLRAQQEVSSSDHVREQAEGLPGTAPERASRRMLDARRIEVSLPDGQAVVLRRSEPGVFEGEWTPSRSVTWPATVEIVTTDRALNNRRIVERIAPEVGR